METLERELKNRQEEYEAMRKNLYAQLEEFEKEKIAPIKELLIETETKILQNEIVVYEKIFQKQYKELKTFVEKEKLYGDRINIMWNLRRDLKHAHRDALKFKDGKSSMNRNKWRTRAKNLEEKEKKKVEKLL